MIGKLLGMLTTFLALVCIATVIAAVALIMFYARSWKVDHDRFVQAVAILQGKSPESLLPPPPPKKENDSEQPAYDQFLAAQGLKARDLEQREMTVRANIQQFQEELNKIVDEKKRVQSVRDDLQAKLDDLNTSAAAAGTENVLQTLQTLKPKQAKDLLEQRLNKGDIDAVVKLLLNMSDSKRAKIIAEFKTVPEMDQIGEVLDRIRQGQPTAGMIDETGKKLQPPRGPGP
jgi:septal ring factor EnvC (AmiA/AmiB activator)